MPAPESAVVHPLVLLSVVDHYNRAARDTKKRVVGLLLGETYKGKVEVANSFACESSFSVLDEPTAFATVKQSPRDFVSVA